jgi:hypothetical protein
MKFTLSWLREHLETDADIKVIESTLTNIGLEVESIEDRTDELKPFTVAKVINVSKHHDADRLKICNVETIKGNVQVVCGAPNAKDGMLGVFGAPQTTCTFPLMVSTLHIFNLSASWCLLTFITFATVKGLSSSVLSSIDSTSNPIFVNVDSITLISASVSKCSRSQLKVNFIIRFRMMKTGQAG